MLLIKPLSKACSYVSLLLSPRLNGLPDRADSKLNGALSAYCKELASLRNVNQSMHTLDLQVKLFIVLTQKVARTKGSYVELLLL